jgi:alpha-D-ribose 1-methylphosphonate 5-triphosphate diphosphatase
MKNQGVNVEEVKRIVENAVSLQEQINWSQLKRLSEIALDMGIPIASHDDDSVDKIKDAKTYGITVSEFPLNMETAQYAKESNLFVCLGAPNVVRGGSHDKNLSAREAIKAGAADILCSDYLPSSLLSAVFQIVNDGIPLPQAVNMATLNPAKAMGTDKEQGSIEIGKAADLLLVKVIDGYPFINRTMVNGVSVYKADFFHSRG